MDPYPEVGALSCVQAAASLGTSHPDRRRCSVFVPGPTGAYVGFETVRERHPSRGPLSISSPESKACRGRSGAGLVDHLDAGPARLGPAGS